MASHETPDWGVTQTPAGDLLLPDTVAAETIPLMHDDPAHIIEDLGSIVGEDPDVHETESRLALGVLYDRDWSVATDADRATAVAYCGLLLAKVVGNYPRPSRAPAEVGDIKNQEEV